MLLVQHIIRREICSQKKSFQQRCLAIPDKRRHEHITSCLSYIFCPVGGMRTDKYKKQMEQSYWMHRVKCGEYAESLAYALLKNHKILSIGWSDFSDSEKQDKLTESWDSFNQVFIDNNYGQPRNRYNLWHFLKEMRKGTIVVVPLYKTFDVYRIVDETVYNNTTIDHGLWVDEGGETIAMDKDGYPAYSDGRQVDIGFYRKVEPVALNISREDYAKQALYSRLKIQQATANIDDLKDDVDYAVKCFMENKPINLRRKFVEEASKSLLGQMRELLNDNKLEELVEWYMRQLGAGTIRPAKNSTSHEEGDADVIATFDRLGGFTIYIQVKAHQGYTDEWAVNQITTYRETLKNKEVLPTHQLWVISTCTDFSKQAKLEAENLGVRLIAGLELAQMIIDEGAYLLPL